MIENAQSWNFEELSPEARRTAERAAEAADMTLESWLNQLIKYVSAMELKGEAPPDMNGLDSTIEAVAAAQDVALGQNGPADHHDELDQPGNPAAGKATRDPAVADMPPPTALSPDFMAPSRFADQAPSERDIEGAIDGWRRAGSLLPVVVRPDDRSPAGAVERRYEIITGAERWYAAQRLKMKLVPVVVTDVPDDELLRATLIDRLRRRSLAPIEEARTYQKILAQGGQSIAGLATDIGCAPSLISDALKLIELPESVQTMIEEGQLSVLHARALLGADDPEGIAREVVSKQLDIYQTEQLMRSPVARPRPQTAPPAEAPAEDGAPGNEPDGEPDREDDTSYAEYQAGDSGAPAPVENTDTAEISMVEKTLSSLLALEVTIEDDGEAGVLSLRYGSRERLRDLVSQLNRAPDDR